MNEAEKFVLDRSGRDKPRRLKTAGTLEITAKTPKGRSNAGGNAYRHTKTGYRPALDEVVRSGWEANILYVFKAYDVEYVYEPTIFYFPIKRGTKAYTPDIYVPSPVEGGPGEWIEIKGYFDNTSRIKMKRFKKYFPEDFQNLTMIIGKGSKTALQICEDLEVPTILFYEDFRDAFKSKINLWEGR